MSQSSAVQQGTEEWLALRKGKITGSRCGAILGLNPYQSRDDVMREMVREWFGASREFTGNEATEHGHLMEPEARRFYERLTGMRVDETDFIVHPKYEFIGGSPDGLVGFDGSVEFKCPYYAKRPYTLAQKPYYEAQCHLVMGIAEVEWIDFLCYFNPSLYHLERLHATQAWWDRNLKALADFHREFKLVVASKKRARKYLTDDGKTADHVEDPKLVQLAEALRRLEDIEEEYKARKMKVEVLRKAIGEEYGTCTNGEVRVERTVKQGAVNWQQVARAAFEIPGVKESIGDTDDWRKPDTYAYSAKLVSKEDR